MASNNTLPIQLSNEQAGALCFEHYQISGIVSNLPGELDHNFKIEIDEKTCYVLKISRPDTDPSYLEFQEKLLLYILDKKPAILFPEIIKTSDGQYSFHYIDEAKQERRVRLIKWIPGRLWSGVNPQLDNLRYSLGETCGEITKVLVDFAHPMATRIFDWDIAQASWTYSYINLFSTKKKECISFFTDQFQNNEIEFRSFRKSVIHNDANDNNIIVNDDLLNPSVTTIIDYGDATYSQIINDLAVAIAYAVMDHSDPLAAALPIVQGYHNKFPLFDEELKALYVLVAIRLVISVTKSAINKQKEPHNSYLQISEKQAWALLYKWKKIPNVWAYYSFRSVCGFTPLPHEKLFAEWVNTQRFSLHDLFPSLNFTETLAPDLSIGSLFLGNFSTFEHLDAFEYRMLQLQRKHPNALLAGGYLEARPVYTTDAFKIQSNNGPEYRTYHLGTDYWLPEQTAIHAICDGEIVCSIDTAIDKDYGPMLIIKHSIHKELFFYTLYGHLSKESLLNKKPGTQIKKGERIAFIGNSNENGNWPPHLHFQIILDLIGYESNFPGVCTYTQLKVWSALCPDPKLLFKEQKGDATPIDKKAILLADRKKHLGKSLSLSYNEPLNILRGQMQYLISDIGRKYLDTVNNVAHVGHEHPRVVNAGQKQMAVLNTNTRYLHENIILFAEELCKTLPKELSVIHFVNSGSEANELALRMAKAFTNQKDTIALEIGYHGNTGACIDISSYKFDGKGGKGKPEHTHLVPLPDSYRGKYQGNLASTGLLYAEHVKETIIDIKRNGKGVSAFIAESMVSCGGQIELPDNYLQTAYGYVREAGGVCIADEVQVGFGRIGKKFWGFELQNVVPDIVTMGKPIGNGHPLAAVVCTPEIAEAFANGMEYFNTFGGNPVSTAIGLEVLKIIQEENLQENALQIGNYLKDSFTTLQSRYPMIGDIRGEGFFLGIELVLPGKIPATVQTAYLANRMLAHGILMSVDGPQNNVLKIKPPMCFNTKNAEELVSHFEKIMKENCMQW